MSGNINNIRFKTILAAEDPEWRFALWEEEHKINPKQVSKVAESYHITETERRELVDRKYFFGLLTEQVYEYISGEDTKYIGIEFYLNDTRYFTSQFTDEKKFIKWLNS
jgi:hypothetical protein